MDRNEVVRRMNNAAVVATVLVMLMRIERAVVRARRDDGLTDWRGNGGELGCAGRAQREQGTEEGLRGCRLGEVATDGCGYRGELASCETARAQVAGGFGSGGGEFGGGEELG
ncbi:uncharacterized protein A4U43_C07F29450 [Asparagus officinalis]|uniref:Uncharacterized protein n=1 Tax=Asparagus officinalis TaxID=4686 RepID=A0A5P1EHV2_ASPOF|nr:uncharacterized protein A4U43_C07F29450 [Asparagus officinalis]